MYAKDIIVLDVIHHARAVERFKLTCAGLCIPLLSYNLRLETVAVLKLFCQLLNVGADVELLVINVHLILIYLVQIVNKVEVDCLFGPNVVGVLAH